MSDPCLMALRMVRDCGVVRVRFCDDALEELRRVGLLDISSVTDSDDALDYRLTVHGHTVANALMKEPTNA